MRRLILLIAAFLMLAPFALADVSGKWSGTAEVKMLEGEAMVLPVRAELKQHDKSVSGSIGKEGEEQYPIEKGINDGGKLSFEFTAPEAEEESGERKYLVRLNVVSESQLQGDIDFVVFGTKVTGKVTLTRAK
jgi:hypothetical protein